MHAFQNITCPSEIIDRIKATSDELGYNETNRRRWIRLFQLVGRLAELPGPEDPSGCVCERCTEYLCLPLDEDASTSPVTPSE